MTTSVSLPTALTSFHSGSAARSLSPKSWPVSVSSAWATTYFHRSAISAARRPESVA
jgi:hypothetical protein